LLRIPVTRAVCHGPAGRGNALHGWRARSGAFATCAMPLGCLDLPPRRAGRVHRPPGLGPPGCAGGV